MPGPAWYAQALFDDDAAHPGRADHRRAAAAVGERDAGHDRPGRRRPVDHLAALQEPDGGGGLRHLGHDGLQPDRQGRTARLPGLRARWPTAGWRHWPRNPYFAADPTPALKAAASQIWSGWNLVTYPDQPVWSNTVVTQLVAGQVAELAAAAVRRRPRPGGAGGRISGRRQLTSVSAPARTAQPRVRAGHAHAWPARGARACRSSLPYLPFLIVFGIVPMVYALDLAFTNDGGGWAGFAQLHRGRSTDFRFVPAFEHILLYTSVWLGSLVVLRRRAGAAAARARQPGLVDLPVPLLHAGRAGRRRVRPGLAVHARPVGQPGLVPAAPRARRRTSSSSRSRPGTCRSSSR